AVVHPHPGAVAEGVAVGLLHGRAGGGADVGEEQAGADVTGDLAQVAVAPGRADLPQHGRRAVAVPVPADAEPVAVGGLHPHLGVQAMVDPGVGGPVEYAVEQYRGARVGEPTAHRAGPLISLGTPRVPRLPRSPGYPRPRIGPTRPA